MCWVASVRRRPDSSSPCDAYPIFLPRRRFAIMSIHLELCSLLCVVNYSWPSCQALVLELGS